MLEKFFSLQKRGTTVRTELVAGLTTFMTVAYILAVNPSILAEAGMDASAVFVATALSAAVASTSMALLANMPLVLAPSMGQNAFFSYTLVLGMGHSWQFALTAVFLVGVIFLVLTLCNVREAMLDTIPQSMKQAMTAGVGLFITFIGLQTAGLVIDHPTQLVALGSMRDAGVWVALGVLLCATVLLCFRVRGALLYGILLGTFLGIPLGVTSLESFNAKALFHVPSVAPTFMQFTWDKVISIDMLVVVLIFLFSNAFDTMATLLGFGKQAQLLDNTGRLPRTKQAFLADSLATTVGAMLGTSPLTTYVESLSGVAEGGRTGLMALTVAVLFVLSLFLAPFFLLIPPEATAPILILVGLMMASDLREVDFTNPLQAVPSFVTCILMPLTYSIATGIMCGVIVHVLLHVCSGKGREVSVFMYILGLVFTAYFIWF